MELLGSSFSGMRRLLGIRMVAVESNLPSMQLDKWSKLAIDDFLHRYRIGQWVKKVTLLDYKESSMSDASDAAADA
ncbi:MAG: hypothetical protein M1836_002410 [Candelina mexicana]|nr:MAG: hypothetical protein M1836_002410 [Candelina mexicana]